MNVKRSSARDRRMVAVHEAGHLVVAAFFGFCPASAWIAPNDAPGDDERTWVGRVQFGQLRHLAPEQRRMVAVAGSVAEHLWRRGWIEDYFPEDLSQSDWQLAGCKPDEPTDALLEAAEEVGRLIGHGSKGWQQLVRESRRLIIDCRRIG